MRLNLGALAALEESLECKNLVAFVERFEAGQFKTNDIVLLLFHGLRGAGWSGSLEELMKSNLDGGPLAAAKAAGNLLRLTFSLPE
jgi:hypothetical protein